jgi:ribosomal protein L37AE/L43A
MIEKYRHTDLVCEDCGNEIVQDIFKGDFYCLKCGLIRNIETLGPVSLLRYNDYNLRQYIYESHTNE